MSNRKTSQRHQSAEALVKDIKRRTRRKFSSEEKIRIITHSQSPLKSIGRIFIYYSTYQVFLGFMLTYMLYTFFNRLFFIQKV